jgi:hypothetical protein
MKTKISFYFNASKLPDGVATILEPAGCGADVADVSDYIMQDVRTSSAWVKLDEGDPRVAKLQALVEQHDVKANIFDYIEYSNEDLETARLLWMYPDINQNVSTGYRYGTKYDFSQACPNCNAGARQTSALYISGRDITTLRKHRAIGTHIGDVLVDGGMAKKLRDAGVTGISFGEVRARLKNKKWSLVAREQILIEHTMPPMRGTPADKNSEHLCKVCQRGGSIWVPDPIYLAQDLEGMQDFNLTWEWFGDFWPEDLNRGIYSRYAKWPSPETLVTPKVYKIFRDAGITTFHWKPVTIGE